MNSTLEQADLLYKNKDFRKAISFFKVVVQEDPKNALAHEGLARCFLATNNLDAAFDEARQALNLAPDLLIPHRVIANIYLKRQQFELYEQELNILINKDKDSVDLLLAFGDLLIYLGRSQEAYTYIKKSVELDPQNWYAHDRLASLYAAQSNYQDAYKEAQKALQINWSITTVHMYISTFTILNRKWLFPIFVAVFVASFLLPLPLSLLPVSVIFALLLISAVGNLARKSQKNFFLVTLILIIFIWAWVNIQW